MLLICASSALGITREAPSRTNPMWARDIWIAKITQRIAMGVQPHFMKGRVSAFWRAIEFRSP